VRRETGPEPMITNPLKDFPGCAVRQASVSNVARLAKRLEAFGSRAADASVLTVINSNLEITQSEIWKSPSIARANWRRSQRDLATASSSVRAKVLSRTELRSRRCAWQGAE